MLPYLVLLRMGFAMPLNVTASAVSSYLAATVVATARLAPGHRFALT